MSTRQLSIQIVTICNKKIHITRRVQYKRSIITIFLILFPELVFLITHSYIDYLYYLIISGILCLYSMLSVLKVLFSDPGYLKPNLIQHNTNPQNSIQFYEFRNKFVEIPLYGRVMKFKYCHTCNIIRPLRASHCDICGFCVEKYDHHCP